jgi:hypothetical protein
LRTITNLHLGGEWADLSPALVDRIADPVESGDDRPGWTQCVERLGPGAVDRALGQLKEASQLSSIRNPGGLLTKIFKDIATEAGIALRYGSPGFPIHRTPEFMPRKIPGVRGRSPRWVSE